MKIGLEPPEYIDRNRYQVNQFEPLTASFFQLYSVNNTLFVEQFFSIWFSSSMMNGHTDKAIQK